MTNEKEISLVKEFLNKYKDSYKNYEDFIINNFNNELGEKSCVIESIKSYLNFYDYSDDKYKGYFEFLKNNYDLAGNILEIASGPFPTLSFYVSDYQEKLGKGSVEVYDPTLISIALKNIILNKKRFNETIDISNKDLIFAMSPCKQTTNIIEAANKNKKDFSILLCPCLPKEFNYFNEYLAYLLELSKKTKIDNGAVDIVYLDDSYNYKYPIIYKKNSNQ